MDGRGLTPSSGRPPASQASEAHERASTAQGSAAQKIPYYAGQVQTVPTAPAGRAENRGGTGKRTLYILGSGLLVAVIAAAAGWYLALQWQGRAETAETEYRQLEQALDASASDVTSLEERQRELAEEKARLEDERTVLATEKAALEEQQNELTTTLDTVTQIANLFSRCSEGYSQVIADLAADSVTPSTQATAQRAETACARGNSLIDSLP